MSELFKKIMKVMYNSEISDLNTFTFKRGDLLYKFTNIENGYILFIKEQITISHCAVIANVKIDTNEKHLGTVYLFELNKKYEN